MKNLLITILSLICLTLTSFADESNEALDFFNKYVNAANTYSPTVIEMYSPSAKIIREVIKPDGTTVKLATDTATYIKQMKLSQATAKLKHYKNTYTEIKVTQAGNGSYKVSSLRQPSGETYKLKTYMILKKQPDGNWLIIEELMQTKVQTLLKFADKNNIIE